MHEVIKYSGTRDKLIIVDEEGMLRGIPKLIRLSLLEYLMGVHMGIPKLERLTLQDLLSSSFITHLKLPSYITHCRLIREVSAIRK